MEVNYSSFENLSTELDQIKEYLVNRILFIGAIFGSILLLTALYTEENYFLSLDFFVDHLIIITLFSSYFYRKRLHIKLKLGVIILLIFVQFFTDTHQFGIISTDKFLFALVPFFSILVYSKRTTFIVVSTQVIVYLTVGYLISIQVIPTITYNELNYDLGNWINYALVIVIIGVITTMFVYNFLKIITQFVNHIDATSNELKNRDTLLRESLQEKEVMLQEIHHRVKNNLAVVSGLIDLQSRELSDENLKTAFLKSKNRVLSIAKVHQMLYQSEDLNKIPLERFISELADLVLDTMTVGELSVKITNNIEADYLNVNCGVPVGIIINELITNSIKYAFTENGSDNNIDIRIFADQGKLHITYSDNGVGIPDFEKASSKSLGFTLIYSLLEQLDASFTFHTTNGFKLAFSFSC